MKTKIFFKTLLAAVAISALTIGCNETKNNGTTPDNNGYDNQNDNNRNGNDNNMNNGTGNDTTGSTQDTTRRK